MSWYCQGCGEQAYAVNGWVDEGGVYREVCNKCGNVVVSDMPDVYMGKLGQKFQNLCNELGEPYEITSRKQKKEVMDRLGVREAGDRINGAPFGTKTWIEGTRAYRKKQFDKDRPAIREVYRRYLENSKRK